MTTLNKNLRAQIVNALLKHTFKAQIDELVQKRAALALDVYRDIFTPAERRTMSELPKGWLPKSVSISVKHASDFTTHHFNGCIRQIKADHENITNLQGSISNVEMLITHALYCNSCAKVYEPDHSLSVRNEKLQAELMKLCEEINNAKSVAVGIVGRFGSVATLIKSWPEIEPFVPVIRSAGAVNLPALVPADLNGIFKLPVS